MGDPRMVAESAVGTCVECGSEAFSICFCPGCDGGTLYVPEDVLDQPEVMATIVSILSDAVAERLQRKPIDRRFGT